MLVVVTMRKNVTFLVYHLIMRTIVTNSAASERHSLRSFVSWFSYLDISEWGSGLQRYFTILVSLALERMSYPLSISRIITDDRNYYAIAV